MAETATIGGLLTLDGDTITYATDGFTEVVGWTPQQLVGRSVWDMIHPDDCEESRRRVALFQAGRPVHGTVNRWRHRDGGWVWLSWSPTEIDGTVYFHGMAIPAWLVPDEVAPSDDVGVVHGSVIPMPQTADAGLSHQQTVEGRDAKDTGMQEDTARIAELEADNERLLRENHDLRESLKVIAYWADAGLSSRIPNVS